MSGPESSILGVLERHVSPLIARSILRMSVLRANVDLSTPRRGEGVRLVHQHVCAGRVGERRGGARAIRSVSRPSRVVATRAKRGAARAAPSAL